MDVCYEDMDCFDPFTMGNRVVGSDNPADGTLSYYDESGAFVCVLTVVRGEYTGEAVNPATDCVVAAPIMLPDTSTHAPQGAEAPLDGIIFIMVLLATLIFDAARKAV